MGQELELILINLPDNTESKRVKKLFKLYQKNRFYRFKSELMVIKSQLASSVNDDEFHKNDLLQLVRQILIRCGEIQQNNEHDIISAKYVSLIWEHCALEGNDEFLHFKDYQDVVLMHHVVNSRNVEVLLSFLMFDWHNPDQRKYEPYRSLIVEADQYKAIAEESLFRRLYDIIDQEKYQIVCLRIIYEYLHVVDQLDEKVKNKIFANLPELMSIEKVFEMKNEEFRVKILKVLIAYWRKSNDDYSECLYKPRLLEQSDFFKLAYQLKQRNHNEFERNFVQYIKQSKLEFGYFFETALVFDNRLLLRIVNIQKMFQVRSFILKKCPFNEINAIPLTNFKSTSHLMNLNIYPFNKKEENILVGMENVIEEIKLFHKECCGDTPSLCYYKPINGPERRKIIEGALERFKKLFLRTNRNPRCFLLNVFGKHQTSRNLLFEHRALERMSLFETILSTPSMKEVIEMVWDLVEIWRHENILLMPNAMGKLLIDYVLKSKDDINLVAFIIPNHSNMESFLTKKHFVVMQNQQHLNRGHGQPKRSVFLRFMLIKDIELRGKFFELIFCLLEELHEINDIASQTEIDKLLLFVDVDKNHQEILEVMQGAADVREVIDEIRSDPIKKFEYEYDFNKLLRYSMKYWQRNDKNFSEYKTKILALDDPFLLMIIQIIEKDEENFKHDFYDNMKKVHERYFERYASKEEKDRLLTEDMFILFRIAIKHGCDKIVEFILDHENFENLNFEFPRNIRPTAHNHFAASKLLEHGFDLGHKGLPPYWITSQVLEEYLDSMVTHHDENLIKINTSFLLLPRDRKVKTGHSEKSSDLLLFQEHVGALKFFFENEPVKHLLRHPVMSTFINLKSYKHQLIYDLNFLVFFFGYMIPFGLLINHHSIGKSDAKFSFNCLSFIELLCVFSTVLILVRELFQLLWFSKTKLEYFQSSSNQLELLMLLLSSIVLGSINFLNIEDYLEYFTFIATLLIIVSTIELLTMLPFATVPLYMMMLRNVAITFFRFFAFFVFIIFAFSVSFVVLFKTRPPLESSLLSDFAGESNTTEGSKGTKQRVDVYNNFDTFIGSFFKTLLMLSGEYTIEPFTLSTTKMIIFFIFVMTSFILFNLIIGLVISDVDELRNNAERLDLEHKAWKFILSAEKWKDIHKNYMEATAKNERLHSTQNIPSDKDEEQDIRKLRSWERWSIHWSIHIMRHILKGFRFIHKLDNIYVNMKTLEVLVDVDRKFRSALSRQIGPDKKYFLEPNTFSKLQEVLKKRESKLKEESEKVDGRN